MYEKFKKIIDARGITPYRVAKETGLTTGFMTDWKLGRYNPKYNKLKKIADYLEIKPEDLIE